MVKRIAMTLSRGFEYDSLKLNHVDILVKREMAAFESNYSTTLVLLHGSIIDKLGTLFISGVRFVHLYFFLYKRHFFCFIDLTARKLVRAEADPTTYSITSQQVFNQTNTRAFLE